ncbi:MAG: hypothetical protein K2X03_17115 [Bryobacteraceae bacterium]|nr:hypothetical protein [Bryobacteraceae bacterium]
MLLSLAQLDQGQLEWRQPALGRKFELSGEAGTYARLELKGLDGASGQGITARAQFSFERQGMLKSHINIRLGTSEQNFAVYEPNFTGKKGTLTYAGGQTLEFQATNFFDTEWQWLTPAGDGLIGFKLQRAGKPSAMVFLADEALERVDLDLLLLLGFYLLLQKKQELGSNER